MAKLKKIKTTEIKNFIEDKETIKIVQDKNEPVFIINRNTKINTPSLLNIEIALSGCERAGVFNKK